MSRQRWRRVCAVLACAAGLLATHADASHAADPPTLSMSDVKGDSSSVSGMLTVRSQSPAQVDPNTLKASIDGKDAPVRITQTPPRQRRAMLVVDTSGSMGASGMATVRAATAQYLHDVPSDVLVGVATFADTAGVDLGPTSDRAAAQQVVDGLISRGDTSLYAGVQSALGALGAEGDRSMVLLSDGADTMAENKAASRQSVTTALNSAGVRVDVVQFKTNDPDALTALRGFAAAGGGSVASAGDTAAVTAAFKSSAKLLEAQVPFSISTPGSLTGVHTLTLAGSAGGAPFTLTQGVDFSGAAAGSANPPAAASAQAAPSSSEAALPRPASPPWQMWLAALLVAVALFAGVGMALGSSLQTRREKRVESIETYVTAAHPTSRTPTVPQPSEVGKQMVAWGERVMSGRQTTKGTMALIQRADLPFRAGEWFLINLAAALLGAVLAMLVARSGNLVLVAVAAAIGAGAGWALPTVGLRLLASRRARAFEQVLPDVLMLVATSLKSGFGLPQALDAVAKDAAEPAAKEFSRALAETRIGTDVPDALDHMATRMDSTAMRWAVMAIRIQREVGGNLAETLHTTAKTLRERASLRRQVSTLSAEGRLSAYILIALPIGVFFYMLAVNYDYISLLWTQLLGIVMLAGALVALVIGVFWMRAVVKIEV